jgi:hypothetical protein
VRTLAILLLSAHLALAAQPMRVAVLPLRDLGLGSEAVAELERTLIEAIAAQPGFSVANLSSSGRLVGPKNLSVNDAAGRAQQLGKEVNASRALVVDVARLGDGQVVYLQGIDPKKGEAVGSTTVSLSNGHPLPNADRDALRGAVVRILKPDQYLGHLILKLDVKGAEAQLDGRPLAGDLARPVDVTVGTHALRVTHPAYHDFLRFLDVGFDQTVELSVPLAAYALTQGEMAERKRRDATGAPKPVPWYRSWWALTVGGIFITGITVGVVIAARPDPISGDRSLNFRFRPTP